MYKIFNLLDNKDMKSRLVLWVPISPLKTIWNNETSIYKKILMKLSFQLNNNNPRYHQA